MNPLIDHLLIAAIILAALVFLLLRNKGGKCGDECNCQVRKLGKAKKDELGSKGK